MVGGTYRSHKIEALWYLVVTQISGEEILDNKEEKDEGKKEEIEIKWMDEKE